MQLRRTKTSTSVVTYRVSDQPISLMSTAERWLHQQKGGERRAGAAGLCLKVDGRLSSQRSLAVVLVHLLTAGLVPCSWWRWSAAAAPTIETVQGGGQWGGGGVFNYQNSLLCLFICVTDLLMIYDDSSSASLRAPRRASFNLPIKYMYVKCFFPHAMTRLQTIIHRAGCERSEPVKL